MKAALRGLVCKLNANTSSVHLVVEPSYLVVELVCRLRVITSVYSQRADRPPQHKDGIDQTNHSSSASGAVVLAVELLLLLLQLPG